MIFFRNHYKLKFSNLITKARKAKQRDVKQAANLSNIIRMLIKYHKELWTVPSTLLKQVCFIMHFLPNTNMMYFN